MPREQMVQQIDNTQTLSIPEQQEPLLNIGGWLDISHTDEYLNIPKPSNHTLPLFSKAERKALSRVVSSNSEIRKHFNGKSLAEISVWGIGSVETDGASVQFKTLAASLYEFNKLYTKLMEADEAHKAELKEQLNELAETLILDANEYMSLHGKSKPKTNKGKNRIALARYITSPQFLGRFVVEGVQENGDNNDLPLANYYTGDSFLYERRYQKSLRKYYDLLDVPANIEVFDKFVNKFAKGNTDARRQFTALFSADSKENEKLIEAMKDSTKEPADMKALYDIMDSKINEILNITITPDMFEKDYALNNTDKIAKFNFLAKFAGDFFMKGAIYSSLGMPYLERIKKTHQQAYEVINKKLDLVSDLGTQLANNASINYCVQTLQIDDYAIFNQPHDDKVRVYNEQTTEERADDFTTFITYDRFVEQMQEREIYQSIYSSAYSFNRKKNRERLKNVIDAGKQKIIDKYENAKKTNPRVNEESLKVMNFALECNSKKLADFYIPNGSRFKASLQDILAKDMGGAQSDFDRHLNGMLRMVRFDEYGIPLDEYKANHEWNIRWIDGYKKAALNPEKTNTDYERCLGDMIAFTTNDDSVYRYEHMCETLSFLENSKDMEFFLDMTRLALRLYDNHISHSTVGRKYWDKLDDNKKEIIRAKLEYIGFLSNFAIFEVQAKYQCIISDGEFPLCEFVKGSDQYNQVIMGYSSLLEDAKKKLDSLNLAKHH